MAAAVLHIVFTEAGAEALRAALALAGRDETVIALADDLAAGSIDAEARFETPFWREALAPGPRRVVWTDRRVARQYAGLMAFVALAGDADFEIIDLTHAGAAPLDRLEAEVVAGLLDRAAPLSEPARCDLVDDWRDLRAENAPLRVVEAGRLTSAPADCFDEAILDQCSPYWMRMALVMEMVLSAQGWRGVWNTGRPWLAARIDALIADGRLEGGGVSDRIEDRELRLPQLGDRQRD